MRVYKPLSIKVLVRTACRRLNEVLCCVPACYHNAICTCLAVGTCYFAAAEPLFLLESIRFKLYRTALVSNQVGHHASVDCPPVPVTAPLYADCKPARCRDISYNVQCNVTSISHYVTFPPRQASGVRSLGANMSLIPDF